MTTYAEKLRDPRWQKLRLVVMQRDNFTCLACGATDKTLNVNHLAYFANPWDAPEHLLETVCEDCHKERSEFEKRLRAIPTRTAIRVARSASIMLDMVGAAPAQITHVASRVPADRGARLRPLRVRVADGDLFPEVKK